MVTDFYVHCFFMQVFYNSDSTTQMVCTEFLPYQQCRQNRNLHANTEKSAFSSQAVSINHDLESPDSGHNEMSSDSLSNVLLQAVGVGSTQKSLPLASQTDKKEMVNSRCYQTELTSCVVAKRTTDKCYDKGSALYPLTGVNSDNDPTVENVPSSMLPKISPPPSSRRLSKNGNRSSDRRSWCQERQIVNNVTLTDSGVSLEPANFINKAMPCSNIVNYFRPLYHGI